MNDIRSRSVSSATGDWLACRALSAPDPVAAVLLGRAQIHNSAARQMPAGRLRILQGVSHHAGSPAFARLVQGLRA